MSNRKVIPLEQELLDDEQNESIQLIKMGFEQLDEGIEIDTPNIDWFEQMVVVQKEAVRKKLLREVTIFVIVALILISMVLFTLYQLPLIFFAIQGIASIFVVAYSIKGFFEQVEKA